jgi:hypothetical protein
MNIDCKFKDGDEVFFLSDNRVLKEKIITTQITLSDNKVKFNYFMPSESYVANVFETKQELLDSL